MSIYGPSIHKYLPKEQKNIKMTLYGAYCLYFKDSTIFQQPGSVSLGVP